MLVREVINYADSRILRTAIEYLREIYKVCKTGLARLLEGPHKNVLSLMPFHFMTLY